MKVYQVTWKQPGSNDPFNQVALRHFTYVRAETITAALAAAVTAHPEREVEGINLDRSGAEIIVG